MKTLLFFLGCFFVTVNAIAQVPASAHPADTVPALVKHIETPLGTKFTSELRPLRGISGAPEPFYSYFWEFGDGNFSFEKDPLHFYKDTGNYKVRLFATNNYDDGKRPPTRPTTVKPGKPKPVLASIQKTDFFKESAVALKTNCMPKPGDFRVPE